MKKNGLAAFTWIAALALLVQGLAACSTTNSPTSPSGDDEANIQKVEVVEDGSGDSGGGAATDQLGQDQGDYVGDGTGKNPSTPSGGGGGTTEG